MNRPASTPPRIPEDHSFDHRLASRVFTDQIAHTYQAVVAAKDRWNQILRDRLRTATRLRIAGRTRRPSSEARVRTADAGPPLSVPVRIEGEVPDSVQRALDPNRISHRQLDLLLNRPLLHDVVGGMDFMAHHLDDLRPRLEERLFALDLRHADREDLRRVRETAIVWLKSGDPKSVVGSFFGEGEKTDPHPPEHHDVLGAYFFRIPEIRLYWIVIGLVARLLEVTVEDLTVVVLAHELAHAYTHLGSDIDRHQWDTGYFRHCHLEVVEGLAQFFAEHICRELGDRLPGVLPAFERLRDCQPFQYRAYRDWVGPETTDRGEIIRVSMIECRRKGVTDAAEFRRTISRYRASVAPPPADGGTMPRR